MKPFSLLSSISAIGLEIWSITKDIYFDNFLITDQEEVALDLAHQIFEYRNNLEEKSLVRNIFELPEDSVFIFRVSYLVPGTKNGVFQLTCERINY